MATVTDIMSGALELPLADRSYLAKKLLESLEEAEALTEEEKAMLERRSSQIRSGKVKPLSLEALKREVDSRQS